MVHIHTVLLCKYIIPLPHLKNGYCREISGGKRPARSKKVIVENVLPTVFEPQTSPWQATPIENDDFMLQTLSSDTKHLKKANFINQGIFKVTKLTAGTPQGTI